jgi:hypothetical protein
MLAHNASQVAAGADFHLEIYWIFVEFKRIDHEPGNPGALKEDIEPYISGRIEWALEPNHFKQPVQMKECIMHDMSPPTKAFLSLQKRRCLLQVLGKRDIDILSCKHVRP